MNTRKPKTGRVQLIDSVLVIMSKQLIKKNIGPKDARSQHKFFPVPAITLDNRATYKGEWRGCKTGPRVFFSGYWKNDKANGKGTHADGEIYD